jgi:hypothetical protein
MTDNTTGNRHGDVRQATGAPSRRELLAALGAAVGPAALSGGSDGSTARADHPSPKSDTRKPTRFVLGKEPVRRRKNFLDFSDTELTNFCKAVGYMKDGTDKFTLELTDPLQWDSYVGIHARHCYEHAKPEHQVHWSWNFWPWHRAFLFFLERHLAHVIATKFGDEKAGRAFALPYWDWTSWKAVPNTKARVDRGMPSPFFGLDLSTDFDPAPGGKGDSKPFNLALWDGHRGPTLARPEMKKENEDIGGWKKYTDTIANYYTHPEYVQSMLRNPNFCEVGGKQQVHRDSGPGLMESGPHNAIHDWLGSRYGGFRDMGSLRYAALDPLFYLHHANVDRIWTHYRFTPKPGQPPPEPDNCRFGEALEKWFKTEFTFVDVDGSPVSVTVADTIEKMITVRYAEDEPTKRLLASAGKKSTGPTGDVAVLEDRGVRLSNKSTGTFSIAAAKTTRLAAPAGKKKEAPTAMFLAIEVGRFYYSQRFQVWVYAAQGGGGKEVPVDDEHFVGAFTALDSHSGGRKGGAEGQHVFHVNVSPKLSNFSKVAPAGKPFVLKLVARGTSSAGKEFFLTVKNVTLKVYP